ncbi:MAG: ROK family protein [Rhodospirillales bacterium]
MRIGIDLGGTKIEGLALDDAGVERARLRVPTPAGDYEGTVAAVAGLVRALERRVGTPCSVGVGIPGTLSPASGLVKNANSTWIIGRPLDRDLRAAIGRPVRIANDANCFAVSEATDGAAAGAGVVFGVILGTGVGGGIVVGGHVLVGLNAIAGEWGHNPLPWPAADEHPGPDCYCGKRGCIETFLSGPALARTFEEEGGGTVPAAAIAALAETGDPVAARVMGRYEDRLARALASVINVLDPDIVVLGGGLSNVDRLYRTVPRLWQDHVFSDRTDTRLVRNRHGDSSGVRGAAWLWPR